MTFFVRKEKVNFKHQLPGDMSPHGLLYSHSADFSLDKEALARWPELPCQQIKVLYCIETSSSVKGTVILAAPPVKQVSNADEVTNGSLNRWRLPFLRVLTTKRCSVDVYCTIVCRVHPESFPVWLHWLIVDWLTDRLIDWLIDWFTDW